MSLCESGGEGSSPSTPSDGHRSSSLSNTPTCEEAGRTLLRDLGVDEGTTVHKSTVDAAKYDHVNRLWTNPDGGGSMYVGNYIAAKSLEILADLRISVIINCQELSAPNYFEFSDGSQGSNSSGGEERTCPFTYHRFPIEMISLDVLRAPELLLPSVQPFFDVVKSSTAAGCNVLVHCYAGAHRAGTAAVGFLMYTQNLDYVTARLMAKERRPLVSPYGKLEKLLRLLERELAAPKEAAAEASETGSSGGGAVATPGPKQFWTDPSALKPTAHMSG